MNYRREVCAWLCVSLLICGCGSNRQTAEISKPSKTVTWPELKAVKSQKVAMGTFHACPRRGAVADVKAAAMILLMQVPLDAFKASKIPAEFASPAGEKAKENAVTALEDYLKLAKGSPTIKQLRESGRQRKRPR